MTGLDHEERFLFREEILALAAALHCERLRTTGATTKEDHL